MSYCVVARSSALCRARRAFVDPETESHGVRTGMPYPSLKIRDRLCLCCPSLAPAAQRSPSLYSLCDCVVMLVASVQVVVLPSVGSEPVVLPLSFQINCKVSGGSLSRYIFPLKELLIGSENPRLPKVLIRQCCNVCNAASVARETLRTSHQV